MVSRISVCLSFILYAGQPFSLAFSEADKSVPARELKGHARVQEAVKLLEIWLDAQRDYEQLPGLSMAVVYDQDLIWSGAYGLADPKADVVATPQTIYSICSISKLFTSTGVMQLRDEGKLQLHDPISKFIPWLKIKETYPEAGRATVEGILTHSSGLPRESNQPYWTGPDFPFPTRDEVMAGISDQQTLYPSSTYFQYSNLGMALAGEIIQQTSGQEYSRYMREHIIEPLGLKHTQPEIPVELVGTDMARGYGILTRHGERREMPIFQARGIAPAAGFASTVEDLGRFASWQFRLLEKGGTEILQANTLREMQRVHWVDPDWKVHWGLGFSVWRDNDKTFVGHGGSCPGFRSHLSLDTKDKVATVFMTNAMGVNVNQYTRNAHKILGQALIEAAKSIQDGAKKEEKPKLDLQRYTGNYEGAWGEEAVVQWKGELALVGLPSDDPLKDMTKLKHKSGDVFHRVRDDGELAEELRFEFLADGSVRLWQHGNYATKKK